MFVSNKPQGLNMIAKIG